MKFLTTDLGNVEFIMYLVSKVSTKYNYQYDMNTFDGLGVDILSLVGEAADITQDHIGQGALEYILQTLHKHYLHLQLRFYRNNISKKY